MQVSKGAGGLDLSLPAVKELLLDVRAQRLSGVTSDLETTLRKLRGALTAFAEQLRAQPAGPAVPGGNAGWRSAKAELDSAAAKLSQHAECLKACAPTAVYSEHARGAMACALGQLEAVSPQLEARPADQTAVQLAAVVNKLRELFKHLPMPSEDFLGA